MMIYPKDAIVITVEYQSPYGALAAAKQMISGREWREKDLDEMLSFIVVKCRRMLEKEGLLEV